MPALEELETEVIINAPLAEVWALVGDPRRLADWSPQVVSSEFCDGADAASLGVRFVNHNHDHGMSWSTSAEIVRLVPLREMAFRVDENWLVWSFTLEPMGAEATCVVHRRESPDGISGWAHAMTEKHMGGTAAFTRSMRDGMDQTLLRIKTASEHEERPNASCHANGARRIRTSRLVLDVPDREDAAEIFAIVGDHRAVAHNPSDYVSDLEEATELIERWLRHWSAHEYGYWCVRESQTGRIVGYCGTKRMQIHGMPARNLIARFHPDVWGSGYATEAVKAALERAGAHADDGPVVARVRPENLASRNVALKLGLRRDPDMDECGPDGIDEVFSDRLT